MDGLIDERAAAFGGPAALDGTRIIGGGTVPFHVAVALQKAAQAALGDGFCKKQTGVVEAVLADYAELNIGAAGGVDHLPSGCEIGGNGLLHLDVLLSFGAD